MLRVKNSQISHLQTLGTTPVCAFAFSLHGSTIHDIPLLSDSLAKFLKTVSFLYPDILDLPGSFIPVGSFRLPFLKCTLVFDTILLDTIQSGREKLATGARTVDEVLGLVGHGPGYPEVGSVVFPDQNNFGATHEISNVLCQTLKGFTAISGIVEKCALVGTSFAYLTWLIHPTKESYEAMPPHIRPTEKQLQVPHPIWIDILQW